MELKFKLKIKDVELELTEEELRELYGKLNGLLGYNTTYIPYTPYYPSYPNTPWVTYCGNEKW